MTVYICENCGRLCVVHMKTNEEFYKPTRCPSYFDYLVETKGSKSNWKKREK